MCIFIIIKAVSNIDFVSHESQQKSQPPAHDYATDVTACK